MSGVLERWNLLDATAAADEVLPCCGSRAWADGVAARRPIANEQALLTASDAVWLTLPEAAWQEAFDSHPRIGEQKALMTATAESLRWSAEEQQGAGASDAAALATGNARYEARFDRIFIVCATGKSAGDMLAILDARMKNDPATELREAVEQQRQITTLRLQRWLHGG